MKRSPNPAECLLDPDRRHGSGLLGDRLVALLAGVKEARAVHEWADGHREIKSPQTAARLRVAYQVARIITARNKPDVAQAWFQVFAPRNRGDRDVSPGDHTDYVA